MTEYSAVAPPQQNFNQSTAFAAALQRAKQVRHVTKDLTATTAVSFTSPKLCMLRIYL